MAFAVLCDMTCVICEPSFMARTVVSTSTGLAARRLESCLAVLQLLLQFCLGGCVGRLAPIEVLRGRQQS
jgi:hypothetical protein